MQTWHHVLRKPQPRINEIKHLRGRSPFYCSSRVQQRQSRVGPVALSEPDQSTDVWKHVWNREHGRLSVALRFRRVAETFRHADWKMLGGCCNENSYAATDPIHAARTFAKSTTDRLPIGDAG